MLSILSSTKQIGMNTPRLPRVKQIASRKPPCSAGRSAQCCADAEAGWGGVAGRPKREGMCVYHELTHVVVQQKLQWGDCTGGVAAVVGPHCGEPCAPWVWGLEPSTFPASGRSTLMSGRSFWTQWWEGGPLEGHRNRHPRKVGI